MSETGLRATDLTVRYGRASALNLTGTELRVPAGRVTLVVGPNGAGKSSLVLALYGSVPAGGQVYLGGRDISALPTRVRARSGLALVPQGRQLFARMSVRENLMVSAELLRLDPERVEQALDRFPILRTRANRPAGVLSGGEQQMMVVARALMTDPSVLLLDEMATGLAPLIVDDLLRTVRELARSGTAVLLASPTIGVLGQVADGGVVMMRGRVVAEHDDVAELDAAYQAAMGAIVEG
ncbi:ATP-binding cassette domain-containing protein [Micromonospora peucetia]|uniref:ATP-binding cassette domain-containing protein n=1 Tax=Micromonospora peucetia TaxID=47871 RepID=A0A1C6W4I1_9ACTN|nr:ATP-binding cassette domain-containing protein [Micromonospora peucetia]MCX4390078.1 ATP-binding cassette domain-containing protein [Micromonospora peucetia]WSA32611.1 ATP-binding cassette domain-containing protein [Micromonospora peucetia]SCL73479.1 amino acid/amide ABC transporter ATP-binding protein 2, HAAT family (TC 3.A.1.4.-) [Micromonospora peucetia]